MNVYLTDQTDRLDQHLKALMGKPVMPFNKTKLREKVTTIQLDTCRPLGQIDLRFLFDYRVFPAHIMTFLTQWGHEGRAMRVGDTIVQQAFLPPTRMFSQKLLFGVRINRIVNEADRKGFSYETLEGHVERGESTFTVQQSTQGLVFKIRTFSEPAHWITKLVDPVITAPYQAYCTQAALAHVKRQITL
jgi:hypothetical protein